MNQAIAGHICLVYITLPNFQTGHQLPLFAIKLSTNQLVTWLKI